MPSKLTTFLQAWLINTVAVLAATHIVHGISYDRETPSSLVIATLVLGILNGFVRPILMFLSLPLLILSLGLFTIVINALLLYFVGNVVNGFHVESFWVACKAALLISIITVLLNSLTGTGRARVRISRVPPRRDDRQPPSDRGDGGPPIIDV